MPTHKFEDLATLCFFLLENGCGAFAFFPAVNKGYMIHSFVLFPGICDLKHKQTNKQKVGPGGWVLLRYRSFGSYFRLPLVSLTLI